MFEKQPRLTDSGVYSGSNRVGSVAEPTGAVGRVARLTVHIDAPHRETIKNNTVFYVSEGRLVLAKLDGFGEPLPAGGVLLGFNSKAGLLWFKTRHLLKNQPAAAGRQAEKLYNLAM